MHHKNAMVLKGKAHKRRAQKTLLLGLLGLMLASCGGGDASESGVDAAQQAGSAPAPSKGPYPIGHVYDDGEFRATYVGLGRLSLGANSHWPDGECYAYLTEVERYNDRSGRGRAETFNPSTKGILQDGSEAERDTSGVSCNTKPLQALGYQSTHKAKLREGESARIWTGTFRLSAAQSGSLEGVSLYGSDELYVPEVSVEATE